MRIKCIAFISIGHLNSRKVQINRENVEILPNRSFDLMRKKLVLGSNDTAAGNSSGNNHKRDTVGHQAPRFVQLLKLRCSKVAGGMRRRSRRRFSPTRTLLLIIVISSTGTSTLTSLPMVLTDQFHTADIRVREPQDVVYSVLEHTQFRLVK